MQITGKILEISPTVNITETFRKREFVIEYAENSQYPELIKFEAIQDKCDLLDNYTVGADLAVDFNLKGRKWTNPQGEVKYFNSLQAWRLSAPQAGGQAPYQQAAAPYPQAAAPYPQAAPAPAPYPQAAPAPAPYQQAPAPAPYPQAAPAPAPGNQMPPASFDQGLNEDVPF